MFFRNGRLRAQWTVTFPRNGASGCELRGNLKIQVLYIKVYAA